MDSKSIKSMQTVINTALFLLSCHILDLSVKNKLLIINGTINCTDSNNNSSSHHYRCSQIFRNEIEELFWQHHQYCHLDSFAKAKVTVSCQCWGFGSRIVNEQLHVLLKDGGVTPSFLPSPPRGGDETQIGRASCR